MEKGEGPLFSPSSKQKKSQFEKWEVFLSGHLFPRHFFTPVPFLKKRFEFGKPERCLVGQKTNLLSSKM